jgi:K+-H+ exchange-related protein
VEAIVYLVPVGAGRYELYSEPPDDVDATPREGFFAQQAHRFRERWREAVHTARRGDQPTGYLARARDWVVCRVAETIGEQRTLWSLRQLAAIELRYPSDLSAADAVSLPRQLLLAARWHHGVWLIVDGVLFALSGLLVLVPGPNVFAYYFGLRTVGHFLSWRGAVCGLDRVEWHRHAEPALAELRELADVPRESRAMRVEAIAASLKLPRLAAFFDRVAV